MATLDTLGIEAGRNGAIEPLSGRAQSDRSSQVNFAKAMEEARAAASPEPTAIGVVEKISKVNAPAEPTEGDLILRSLQSTQKALDPQNAMAGDITYDFKSLLELQQKVANYSITTELTSKVAGKLVQTTDTLLKG